MNCPNCAIDMESNAHGVSASKKAKKVTHTYSECGYKHFARLRPHRHHHRPPFPERH